MCPLSCGEVCATRDSFRFVAPDSLLNAGTNVLAVRGRDRGGESYLDVQVTVDEDTTSPVIVPTVVGTLGANDWYTSDVGVSWSVTDPDSAITTTSGCDPTTVTADTAGVTFTCSATSGGGTSSQSVTVKRDATGPSINIGVPTGGAYTLHQAVAATYSCSDEGAGVATCAGSVANGSAIDTTTVGAKSFTVTATDAVGDPSTQSVTYTVGYAICALYDQTKAHKSGSTVPIKLQLCDANGVDVSSAGVIVNATGLAKKDATATASVDDAGAANSPDNNFRYDATLGATGGYIYNLSTKGLTTGTWALSFTAGGATYTVTFDVQ
jgi:hypothetical protein